MGRLPVRAEDAAVRLRPYTDPGHSCDPRASTCPVTHALAVTRARARRHGLGAPLPFGSYAREPKRGLGQWGRIQAYRPLWQRCTDSRPARPPGIYLRASSLPLAVALRVQLEFLEEVFDGSFQIVFGLPAPFPPGVAIVQRQKETAHGL